VVAPKVDEVAGSGLGAKSLIDAPLDTEVSKSFLEYSMSVVYSRALPSIIDGLKPVQRRILYSMYEEGYTPDKGHVKSAKPVSSTMGNYHPHGDSSIYMALVKLAQPFYLNVPLVDGYGNFGDVTGSGPAASRYTEAKLSADALLLLSELKENTVAMRPNYSDDLEEPVYLPVQFPNLLVNGNFGIAVGFASNFAQHNGIEALNAAKYLLKNPEATVAQLMKYIPGPDFPTGGQIIGKDGILSAYTTGQGIIKIRGTYTIVPEGRGKHNIVFSELPYGAKTETIITKIKESLKMGKLTGIADAEDLTDHANGLRFVVQVKAGVNPQAVASELFRLTPLEESFGINNTCLVDGEPKTVGLIEILQSFLNHRFDVVTRRSQFRKDKRDARLHLIEGLLKALANIDEVIKIIRNAVDTPSAKDALIKKFKLDSVQADYILDIPLRRLTKFDQIQLNDEKAKLIAELIGLNKILTDDAELRSVVGDELDAVRKQLSQPRRSVIVDGDLAEHVEAAKIAAKSVDLEIEDAPCTIYITAKGGIGRTDNLSANKAVLSYALTTTRGKFIAVSNKGRAFRIDAVHVGEKESAIVNSLPEKLPVGEKIIAVTPVALGDGKTGGIAIGTRNGNVKITAPQWPVRSDDFSVIGLEGDDEIMSAAWVEDVNENDFVFITDDTSLLTFPASKVRPQGLSGAGMAGIKLTGTHVVSFNVIAAADKEKSVVVTVSDANKGKVTEYPLYPAKGRATGGVRSMKLNKGETKLVFAYAGAHPVLLSSDGKAVKLPPTDKKRDGSGVALDDGSLF
jgi:DNA gyrase subunit A